ELARLGADARHVLFLARGSSDNAATYGRYLCEVHAGRAASLGAPSLATLYRARTDLHGVLAVALSPSGGPAGGPWPCPSRARRSRASPRCAGRRGRAPAPSRSPTAPAARSPPPPTWPWSHWPEASGRCLPPRTTPPSSRRWACSRPRSARPTLTSTPPSPTRPPG